MQAGENWIVVDVPNSGLDIGLLRNEIGRMFNISVSHNSLPQDGGIAVYDCLDSKTVDWKWPNKVIATGDCPTLAEKRVHVDVTLQAGSDMTGQIISMYETTQNELVEDEGEAEPGE